MSRRNSPAEKKKRRLIHMVRETPPASIDLIHYVRLRTRCSAGMARKVLLAGVIRADGKSVGITEVPDGHGGVRKVVNQYVPAELRDKLEIADLPNG